MNNKEKLRRRKQIYLIDEIENILNSRIKSLDLEGELKLNFSKEDETSFYYDVIYKNKSEIKVIGTYEISISYNPRKYLKRTLKTLIPVKKGKEIGPPVAINMDLIEREEYLK
ncbi:MAG: hypothetical protein AABX77_00300 [Nanoarchaeota archaeon]